LLFRWNRSQRSYPSQPPSKVCDRTKSLPVDGRGTGPILVTFGGNGFDLPLLRYRAFALGVPVPGLHAGGHRNYWHRFGSDHIDLCDVLSGYGGSTKPSLAEKRRWRKFR